MAISLSKGGNVNLSKEAPSLTNVLLGLGWQARTTDGKPFDLDVSAFLLSASGKVRSDADFIFYNNLKSVDGSVAHTGDNKTGDADGDDESVKVNLATVPSDVDKIAFTATIHDGEDLRQNFGSVSNAYIRVVDESTGKELARYDLSEDASVETAMIFGELYRNGGDWKFRAVGQGFKGGLGPLAKNYGVNIG